MASSAPAPAKLKPIVGKLSKPGYDLIALAPDGRATAVRARTGRFRLRPLAAAVTLQLRTPNGGYAGPVVVGRVVGRRGRRVLVGVKSGARLGRIGVRRGYARLARKPAKRWIDPTRTARARKGVPIGARVLGRVRSKPPRSAATRGDLDRDGIPDALDIDDDGDLVLDNLDASSAGGAPRRVRAAEGGGAVCEPIASNLQSAAFFQSANVNAFVLGGLSPGEIRGKIDEDLAASQYLRFSPGTISGNCSAFAADSVELDCGGAPDPANPDGWIGGLSYCTRGGSGRTFAQPGQVFPGPALGQFDSDGDGKGTLPMPSFLRPGATSAQIKTGDPLPQVVTNADGTETQYPASLNFVFVTTPALVSYSDTAGNCAKVPGTPDPPPPCATPTEFSYPMAGDAPGNATKGFPVAGGPCPPDPPPSCVAGDVVLTLTFWRPQRERVPQDPPGADWMDIGGLTYGVGVGGQAGGDCAQPDFFSSDLPASTLSGRVGLTDAEGDPPASPGNTFTYKVDLSRCYLAGHGTPFASGDEVPTAFGATSGALDTAGQTVFFRHQ